MIPRHTHLSLYLLLCLKMKWINKIWNYKQMFYQCLSFTPKLMCFHFDSKCVITRLHRKRCYPDLSCHCLGLWFYAGITKILSNSVKEGNAFANVNICFLTYVSRCLFFSYILFINTTNLIHQTVILQSMVLICFRFLMSIYRRTYFYVFNNGVLLW